MMESKTIKLYHFSSRNFSGKLLPKYYGQNSYTAGDKKCCNIKRIFFYLKPKIQEYYFRGATYLYVVKIELKKLYDLRRDTLNLIDKTSGINSLLIAIKKLGYKGIIYQTNGLLLANTFKSQKIAQKIKLKGGE